MTVRTLGVVIGATLCLVATTASAEDVYPRFYPGASVGGHLVLNDWTFGELNRTSQPANAESSLLTTLRLGVDLSAVWAVEISGAHLPFDAATETNDGLDFAARVRWTFSQGGLAPFLMAGAGAYVNPQADPDSAGAAVRPEIHYGIGIGPQLGDHLRLRLDLRHLIAFGGGETGHNLAALAGLDFLFGGGEDEKPDEAPAPSDRDGDGIVDGDDRCPDAPEDLDGIQDTDGCPEDDADQDGVLDAADGCPLEAEDKDGVADADGCPEEDADGDGIKDADDRCPIEAETVNQFEDTDGCPDTVPVVAKPRVEVTCAAIEFDELVFFDLDQHALRAEADALINEVAQTMKARPDLRRVRVSGFADATGSEAHNAQLSKQRAESVRAALIGRGVEGSRLTVKARGTANPRASNATDEGRAQNRRVELSIVERDADARCPAAQ